LSILLNCTNAGNSIVKLDDLSEVEKISKKYNLQVLKTFSHLQNAIFQSNKPGKILTINESISMELGIISSEVEALENACVACDDPKT